MESQHVNGSELRRRRAYTVRRIKPADFPAVAGILAKDDGLCKATFPRMEEYHNYTLDGSLRSIRSRYWSPGWVMYVAVTDPGEDDDSHKEKIVGYAAWKRTGTSPAAQAWIDENEVYWNGIQLSLCNMQDGLTRCFRPDKSANPCKASLQLENNFPSSMFPELWYLATVAVKPAYQGEGLRALLTRRGISHAIDENVPIGLELSAKDRRIYEKMGFRLFKTTMKGGLPVPLMVWRPPGPPAGPGSAREWQRSATATRLYMRCP